MNRQNVIQLIIETNRQDDIGQWQTQTTERKVYAAIDDIGQKEWFEGGRNGLNPEFKATIFTGDYKGEKLLKFKNTIYSIYRTYSKDDETTLYVELRKGIPAPTFKVSFNANGGEGTMEAIDTTSPYTIPEPQFTRESYSFTYWNTAADGTGESFMPGEKAAIENDLTLYAQWQRNTFTVSFNANGGTGTMETIETTSPYQAPACTFTKENEDFANWNTIADGSGITYQEGENINLTQDIELFAQWDRLPEQVAVLMDNGDLVFIKTRNTYTLYESTTAIDIRGDNYPGRVVMVGQDRGWQTYISSIRKIYTGGNYTITMPTTIQNFFVNATNLIRFEGKYDTTNTTSISGLFRNCTNLNYIDLTSFDTSALSGYAMNRTFEGAPAETLIAGEKTFAANGIWKSTRYSHGLSMPRYDQNGDIYTLDQMVDHGAGTYTLTNPRG